MTITALPTPPSRANDGFAFAQNARAFVDALPQFGAELNAVESTVNQVLQQSILIANALQSVGVNAWQAATSYAIGDLVYSPVDYQVYRSILADPGLNTDPTVGVGWYWAIVMPTGSINLTSAQTLSNKSLQALKQLNVAQHSVIGTDQVLSWSGYAVHDVTLTANAVFTFSSLPSTVPNISQEIDVIIRRTGGSSYTVTWPTITWLTTGLTAPATAQMEHYKLRYSSATGVIEGRLIAYVS